MITQNGLKGIGAAGDPLPDSILNYQIPVPGGGGGTGSGFLNWFTMAASTVDKILPTVKTGINIVDQIRTKGGAAPGGGLMVNNNPPPPVGMSANTKIALGVGAAALIGTVIYASTSKKKKK